MSELRPLTEYVMICVRRLEADGVTAYLADAAEIIEGAVIFAPSEWTWAQEEGGPNTREFFEDVRTMAIPLWRVTEIYWPAVEAEAGP